MVIMSSDIKQEKTNLQEALSDARPLITFSSDVDSYCVGLVDIVNSSKIASRLNREQTCKYYGIFLNTMAKIVQRHHGSVVKNIGDCILYYFPESIGGKKDGLIQSLECGTDMSMSHFTINECLAAQNLPGLDYRISIDYGSVLTAKSPTSNVIDIFGPTVNTCSKINRSAKPNCIVVGNDMYEIINKLPGYKFHETSSHSFGLKNNYPIYAVKKSTNDVWLIQPSSAQN